MGAISLGCVARRRKGEVGLTCTARVGRIGALAEGAKSVLGVARSSVAGVGLMIAVLKVEVMVERMEEVAR